MQEPNKLNSLLAAWTGIGGVESRCGAVAVGQTYPFPPLSSGGALVARP
jgi:hypothetical protein